MLMGPPTLETTKLNWLYSRISSNKLILPARVKAVFRPMFLRPARITVNSVAPGFIDTVSWMAKNLRKTPGEVIVIGGGFRPESALNTQI